MTVDQELRRDALSFVVKLVTEKSDYSAVTETSIVTAANVLYQFLKGDAA